MEGGRARLRRHLSNQSRKRPEPARAPYAEARSGEKGEAFSLLPLLVSFPHPLSILPSPPPTIRDPRKATPTAPRRSAKKSLCADVEWLTSYKVEGRRRVVALLRGAGGVSLRCLASPAFGGTHGRRRLQGVRRSRARLSGVARAAAAVRLAGFRFGRLCLSVLLVCTRCLRLLALEEN